MNAREWQFDGLVGPTHNYAGLSFGNVASDKNAGLVSNPKLAALQGLEKMRFITDLGVPQAFLPPQKRPIISELQRLGFGAGNSQSAIHNTIDNAAKNAPHLLAAVFSSSFMWAANAMTVSPGADTGDGKVHFTPANLTSHYHRSVEAGAFTKLFKIIFHNDDLFVVHNPLPSASIFSDEGAANHMRISSSHAAAGVEVFVYGMMSGKQDRPRIFPARQNREASEAIIRSHCLAREHYCLVQQAPKAIDAGVFHNDVIAMNTTGLMVAHEEAFLHKDKFIDEVKRLALDDFNYVEIPSDMLSLESAVSSYLFNSQLLELPDGRKALLAPIECEEQLEASNTIHYLMHVSGVISEAHFLNVRESMRNGGGPACLRLRVVLTDEEAASMHSGIIINDARLVELKSWVERFYRDRFTPDDFRDPMLITQLNSAYEALERIIGMHGLYHLDG